MENSTPIRSLLIEIGTEELPPRALTALSKSFEKAICADLAKAGLSYGEVSCFATPRRLGVLIEAVPAKQPDRRVERRGPALKAAFDAEGNPSKAAEGFARSCGVTVAQLDRQETDKGAWLVHTSTRVGGTTVELVPDIVRTALNQLPIPRRMRWSDRDEEFVRPVHWAVMLYGSEAIQADILGIPAGRKTYGHRFHHPESIIIEKPQEYCSLLETRGKVIADFQVRREKIREQAKNAAATVDGQAVIEKEVLEEVTALVEWPVALVGSFERRFLCIPAEVLISTMQDHQKYFPVVDRTGRLMPHFIAISNLESLDPSQVKAGNERVIRPRFSDAEFFWNQDRKTPLSERQAGLRKVVFQQQLGSLYDKSDRVASLVRYIARSVDGAPDWAERAARLAKCDLLTDMVQEFPELQGVMGRYYAQHDGEAEEVCIALEEQYRPRFSGDSLPSTTTGRALALADRLDTLVGIFAIGQGPTSAKDPFALRRAALGVLRILIEGQIALDLRGLLSRAAQQFDSTLSAETSVQQVFDFVMDRLRGYYLEQAVRPDSLDAVLACSPTCPLDIHKRIRAVVQFRQLPESASLAAANKRIRNILKKVKGTLPFEVQIELLEEEAEQALAAQLAELSSEVIPLFESGLYDEALRRLATLRESVDTFFDEVMVMVENDRIRSNRIALLNDLGSLFLRVADFSRLQD